jgi:signal transduction histidine kinase
MAEAVERVRATADQRGVSIEMNEPPRPIAVLGDRRQLVSAMHALLENAVTYSYDNSTVQVSATIQREPLAFSGPPSGIVEVATGTTGGLGTTPSPSASAAASVGTPPAGTPRVEPEQRQPVTVSGGFFSGAPSSGAPAVGATITGVASAGSATVDGGGADGRAPATQFLQDAERLGERETVRIAVVDHGIGIPARDLDRIFERFYRVDHGRSRDTGGTGLGLSIVRHVASNHHGWVDVESREGEGSTFTLVLPLQPDRAP